MKSIRSCLDFAAGIDEPFQKLASQPIAPPELLQLLRGQSGQQYQVFIFPGKIPDLPVF